MSAGRPKALLSMWADVVCEVFPPDLRAELEQVVELLDPRPLASLDDPVAERLDEAEVLVTSWGALPVDEALLARAPRLRAVFHAAGSIKGTVHDAGWRSGLVVTSAAALGAQPVVEYTVAVITLAAHRVFPLAQTYREGSFVPVRGRRGRPGTTVGIVGASAIGRGVIERLVADDWDVSVYDPVVDPAVIAGLGARQVELDELCAQSDIVSLHAPDVAATRRMMDARRLALMKDGATLVNTARGALVDHDALRLECASGRIDAVLDVTDPEPLPPGDLLLRLPNVFCTPHAAGVQGTEVASLGAFMVEELRRYAHGEPLEGAIDHRMLPVLA
ncbi:hydroxyacid dehydrogenase [Herbiconiux sp. KACC 21604]|uniref:hydroxyacid dehydrogenase n=1 Tax=unclassified Herbiconiux TaxID=2618217 RepID=UPI001C11AA22|nr:hydroxyacid dehydrogenase [Herbiconiux sp. SALV-R1]WPO87458.1 hydroxyacid dehydrogenase [Herbiconiux sp. KACC 21604]